MGSIGTKRTRKSVAEYLGAVVSVIVRLSFVPTLLPREGVPDEKITGDFPAMPVALKVTLLIVSLLSISSDMVIFKSSKLTIRLKLRTPDRLDALKLRVIRISFN
jgi:hypothetical protein